MSLHLEWMMWLLADLELARSNKRDTVLSGSMLVVSPPLKEPRTISLCLLSPPRDLPSLLMRS